jgi:glycosyltransferase involved in cell wall biosynthesis
LYFGAIRPYKGVATLLEAFKAVSRAVPQSMLLIAGQPWMEWKPLDTIASDPDLGGRVRTHLGFVPSAEVEQYFAAADVVVLPYTHFDAQSGVAAVALSFGRAMVVSRVGGLVDVVRDSAAVVPPNDPGALGRAISAVLSDRALQARLERDSMELAGGFGWDEIAVKTVAVYESVLKRSPRAVRAG